MKEAVLGLSTYPQKVKDVKKKKKKKKKKKERKKTGFEIWDSITSDFLIENNY